MANTCVYCGSMDNLNTTLSITIDDVKHTVYVCDTHAEDASIKTAKIELVKRLADIEELKMKARALGLDITGLSPTPTAGGLIIPQTPQQMRAQAVQQVPQTQQVVQSPPQHEQADHGVVAEGAVRSRLFDAKYKELVPSVVAASSGIQPPQRAHNINIKEVDRSLLEGVVVPDVVNGRCGMPVVIPALRKDGMGTTTIKTVTMTTQDMDNRFKDIALRSRDDNDASVQAYREIGYQTMICPLCRGSGVVRNRGREETCPKCKGECEI